MPQSLPIYPVILCGGTGTRLWPLSRKSYPKQFAPLHGDQSLFQETVSRLSAPGFGAPLVITNSTYRFIVTEQLAAIGVDAHTVAIEPQGRNTAPAVLAAALRLQQSEPDALMLIAPSDHAISEPAAFRQAVLAGRTAARNGKIVTFGIPPDRAETGFGWLELASPEAAQSKAPSDLLRFIEKPDLENAERMLQSGKYLWNGGIFLFSAQTIVQAFERYAPDMIAPCRCAVEQAQPDLGFLRLDPDAWAQAQDISIDYAVMEKADNLVVVPYKAHWNDLGSWQAVWQDTGKDHNGVATFGNALAIDCENSLLRAEAKNQQLVGLGLKNIAAIAMPDAVLVVDMDRTQNVGQIVKILKADNILTATQFPKDHRPWGWFETLSLGSRFQVKRIMVHPGASLSLQSHVHRSEHWVIVEGTAEVTVGKKTSLLGENQSVYIPLGKVHRLANPGKVPLHLIEVQSGAYLGEDDITRYDDVYARPPKP